MIFNKIHLHPILILFIILSLLTGTFIQLITLLTIVFIHELGHVLAATYFKWRIESIMLWVFGGVMKTDETTNPTIKEEIVVTVAGPFQHLIVFVLLQLLAHGSLIPEEIIKQAHYYNGILLLFNLLPIYPLDGGKLLLSLLAANTPFKKAYDSTIFFSICACIGIILYQIIFFPFTLSAFMLFLFLLWENWQEWKHRYYLFMRFLLSRTSHQRHSFIRVPGYFTLMDVFHLFRRNYTHTIYIHDIGRKIEEKYCINKYVNEQRIHDRIDKIWGNE